MLKDGTDIILLFATYQASLLILGIIWFLVFRLVRGCLGSILSYSLLISFGLVAVFLYFSTLIKIGFSQTGRMAEVFKACGYMAVQICAVPMLLSLLFTGVMIIIFLIRKSAKAQPKGAANRRPQHS